MMELDDLVRPEPGPWDWEAYYSHDLAPSFLNAVRDVCPKEYERLIWWWNALQEDENLAAKMKEIALYKNSSVSGLILQSTPGDWLMTIALTATTWMDEMRLDSRLVTSCLLNSLSSWSSGYVAVGEFCRIPVVRIVGEHCMHEPPSYDPLTMTLSEFMVAVDAWLQQYLADVHAEEVPYGPIFAPPLSKRSSAKTVDPMAHYKWLALSFVAQKDYPEIAEWNENNRKKFVDSDEACSGKPVALDTIRRTINSLSTDLRLRRT